MPLGFNSRPAADDERVLRIRYHATGPAGGTFSDPDHDDIGFYAVVDFEHIRTGWILFESGFAPDIHWDDQLGTPGPKPGAGHKRGLGVRVWCVDPDIGLRELITNGAGICAAIDKVYCEFEFAPQRAQGLLPLVECTAIIARETPFGTIYDPEFTNREWQSRPPRLSPPQSSPQPQRPPPQSGAPGLPARRDELDDNIPF
jgi:hypothetical protein